MVGFGSTDQQAGPEGDPSWTGGQQGNAASRPAFVLRSCATADADFNHCICLQRSEKRYEKEGILVRQHRAVCNRHRDCNSGTMHG
jgi:hypothetical protein